MDTKDNRIRNWNIIVYPESAPENWKEILDNLHVPWYCSPLHDKDINPDGSVKKAHWHVTLAFTGKQSYETVEAITKSLNAPRPDRCRDMKGSLRYMAHMDNPEKHQYDPSGIECHCGADLASVLVPTKSERHKYLGEMTKYISENNITEFCEFSDICRDQHFSDWWALLCDNSAIFIEKYINSFRNAPKVNPETGEVYEKRKRSTDGRA